MNRRSVVAIILGASFALCLVGCTKRPPRGVGVPPPPEKARIEAAIASYEKHKENGEDTAPLSELRDNLRMLVDSWENYEYAKKEQQKMAIKFNAQVKASKVDLQVSETRRYDAEAQAAKHRRHFWIAVAVGAAVAAFAFGVGAIAF